MTVYSDTLRDENNAPIPGVSVYVYDASGQLASGLLDEIGVALANPLTTDAFGNFSFDAPEGFYTLDLFLGGRRAWKQNVILGVIPLDGAKGLLAETRAAIAAITGQSAAQTALLGEPGREGTFVWETANHAAHVTADPLQGIYIAPASAPTGASGAWVRKFSGPMDVRWFGAPAVGDCTAVGVGTDIAPAINAAVSLGLAVGKSSAILVPGGRLGYRIASPLTNTSGIKLSGQGFHENPGNVGGTIYTAPQNWRGSILVFDPNIAGLKFIGFTDNLANATAFEFEGSSYSIVEDIALYGGGGTSVTAHGIETRVNVNLRNVRVENFAGNGVYTNATTAGAVLWGNANLAKYDRVITRGNKCHGFFTEGSDSNVIKFTACDSALNGGAAFLDKSLIGNNHYDDCHAATNNQSFGLVTAARTQVLADCPALADQYAGSYMEIGGQQNLYSSCYVEIGLGIKGEVTEPSIVIGGTLAETSSRTAAWTADVWHGGSGTGLAVQKISSRAGLSLLHAAGSSIDMINSAGGTALVRLRPGTGLASNLQMMGVGDTIANGLDIVAINAASYFSSDGFTFRNAAQTVNFATFDATGINITATTPQLKINGTKVVGARDTGWAADTGTAKKTATAAYVVGSALTAGAAYVQAEATAVITRQALIEAALRDGTQEIKAIKDALIAHGLIGT